jgi:ribosomal protein L22
MAEEKDIKNSAEETEAVEAAAEETKSEAKAEKPKAEKKAPAKKKAADADAEEKTEAKADEKQPDEKAEKKAPAKKKTSARKPAGKKAAAKKAEPAEPTYVRATARYVRSAPRKARLVVDHIRGESVEDARVFLQFTARHVGRDVAKVLESAVANAEHNHELDGSDLHVVKAYVDEGPTLKRWRPRAKGRATQILKRTSHITVVVSDVSAKELNRRAHASAKTTQNRKAAA